MVHGPTPDRTHEVLARYDGPRQGRALSAAEPVGVAQHRRGARRGRDRGVHRRRRLPGPGLARRPGHRPTTTPRSSGSAARCGTGPAPGSRSCTRSPTCWATCGSRTGRGFDLSYLLARPGTPIFTYPIGTNSSFRRHRLVEIGGFDEEFDYGWDDVDLCRRLIDAGWVVRVLEDGYVHHKSLPSAIRGENRAAAQPARPAQEQGVLHAQARLGGRPAVRDGVEPVRVRHRTTATRSATSVEKGLLDPADLDHATRRTWRRPTTSGRPRGRRGSDRTTSAVVVRRALRPSSASPPCAPGRDKLHLCFLTAEYPPSPVNGIGRVVHELATGLGRRGHEVHVLTAGREIDRIDLEDDVWVHRLVPPPPPPPGGGRGRPGPVWDYAATLCDEALRIDAQRRLDLVQAPNWGSRGDRGPARRPAPPGGRAVHPARHRGGARLPSRRQAWPRRPPSSPP